MAGGRDHLVWVAVHAVAGKLLGALTLAVVPQGFGVTLGVDGMTSVYALALLAAELGPLPAGFGTTEASLTGRLTATGVDGPTALAAAMALRAFDLWLPVLTGAVSAPFVLRRTGEVRGRQASRPAHRFASACGLPGDAASSTLPINSASQSSPLLRR
jgi:uncharacterized membrane protein YbhN (UPF0104 family)